MMITYKKGDLLADEAFALVNTVNLGGVMGKGIALAFKKEFPFNYRCYVDGCQGGLVNIGSMFCMEDHSLTYGAKFIINFPTKIRWWLPAEYSYIELGLKALVECINHHELKSVAIPALGCNNGGLDWHIVKPMMEKHLSGADATINIMNNTMKTIIYFIITCFISTACMFGALNAPNPFPLFAVAFGIWAWFIWGCHKRMKRKAEQRNRERLFDAYMGEQLRHRKR